MLLNQVLSDYYYYCYIITITITVRERVCDESNCHGVLMEVRGWLLEVGLSILGSGDGAKGRLPSRHSKHFYLLSPRPFSFHPFWLQCSLLFCLR